MFTSMEPFVLIWCIYARLELFICTTRSQMVNLKTVNRVTTPVCLERGRHPEVRDCWGHESGFGAREDPTYRHRGLSCRLVVWTGASESQVSFIYIALNHNRSYLNTSYSRSRPYSLKYYLQKPNSSNCEQHLATVAREKLPFNR